MPKSTKKNMKSMKSMKSKSIDVSIINDIALEFFRHQLIIKLFHFQTKKYGAHKTSDAYLSKFLKLYDDFLETAQGIYGRINIKQVNIPVQTTNDNSIISFIDKFCNYLSSFETTCNINNTDLLNIRDEILGEADQFKYLLTFH